MEIYNQIQGDVDQEVNTVSWLIWVKLEYSYEPHFSADQEQELIYTT